MLTSDTDTDSGTAPAVARTVCVVATGDLGEALREAIADRGSLRLLALEARFTDLVVDAGFPGDVVLLAEEPGRALFAHAQTAVAAGAMVFVLADVDAESTTALESAGVVVLPADEPADAVASRLATAPPAHRRSRQRADDTAQRRPRLSHGERRALAHYVQGLTTVQVAAEMGVGYETAKTFLRRVRAKYAAVDRSAGKRAQLILRAEEDGIL